jgi:hypothetical protein
MVEVREFATASPRPRSRSKKGRVAKQGHANGTPKLSTRGKQGAAEAQVQSERYTPLLSRESYTFSRMRTDRGGPQTYSAICFPGWIRDPR